MDGARCQDGMLDMKFTYYLVADLARGIRSIK